MCLYHWFCVLMTVYFSAAANHTIKDDTAWARVQLEVGFDRFFFFYLPVNLCHLKILVVQRIETTINLAE